MVAYRRFSLVAILLVAAVRATPAFAATRAAPQSYIQKSAHVGTLQDGKVVFSGNPITIQIVAVAPGAPDATFEIHGRVNPTLVVPARATLRFELANNDSGMAHALDVTTTPPPYAPVSANLPITSPLDMQSIPGLFAATGMVPARHNPRAQLSMRSTAWFRLASGTYYYVCAVADHAQRGMYGKLIVRQTGN